MDQQQIDNEFAAIIAATEDAATGDGIRLFERRGDFVVCLDSDAAEFAVAMVDQLEEVLTHGFVASTRLNQPMYDDAADQAAYIGRHVDEVNRQRLDDCRAARAAFEFGTFGVDDIDPALRALNAVRFALIGEFDDADVEENGWFDDTPRGHAALMCAVLCEQLIEALDD